MDLHRLVDVITLVALGAIAAGFAGVLVTRTSCAGDIPEREEVPVVVTRAEAAAPVYEPSPTVVTYNPGPSAEEVEEIAERAAARAVAAERARQHAEDGGPRKSICDEDISFYQREQLDCPEREQ